MPRGEYLKPEELEYIRNNVLSKTDDQLAEYLKRDSRTIRNARRRLGINKSSAGQVVSIEQPNKHGIVGHTLTDDQRKEFFKTQLVNSLYYKNLQEQFSKLEIDFYLEEWAALSIQFDDIANTEKRQIDELIKAEIMGNRILRNIKIAEDEIELLIKETDDFRKSNDITENEVAQERDALLMSMIRSIHAQSQAMSNDYQKNVDMRNRLLDGLNCRRKDRIDQIKKGGTTFIGLVEALRDRQLREVQGRHIELVRLAKEKKKNEWNKSTKFPDGSIDCILMDESSELPVREQSFVEEKYSKLISKYRNLKEKKILIIDDEMSRKQFFSDIFKMHTLRFASNTQKAIDLLKDNNDYDLICLDYDLGMENKGSEIVNYILNKEICKDSEILIHSMNPEGAEKMRVMLSGERPIEVYSYENIVKGFKELELLLKDTQDA
jgi:CheY-like chemotaxis protein